MSNKRQYKSDSQEFKEEAIALLTEQGYNVPEAAASLDICPNQLYSWKQKQEAAKGDRLLSVDERSEWLALRRENKRLRMEKEILIRTHEGWMYLAIVMDLYPRKIIGWAMDKRMTMPLIACRI